MKQVLLYSLILLCLQVTAQPRIHAHNDYAKPEPLYNALRNKAFSIEADVYPGDSLFVSHDKKDIQQGKNLVNMYLQPIIQLFTAHHGSIGDDTAYASMLVIDIKENGEAVIQQLINLLSLYRNVFDKSVNKHAVQVVLSGDRTAITGWHNLPAYILFDGRPSETYDSITLKRVAFISDSYLNYIKPADSIQLKLQQLITATHNKGKLLRLWAIPDNETYWKQFYEMGIDIINTDKVAECKKFFTDAYLKQ